MSYFKSLEKVNPWGNFLEVLQDQERKSVDTCAEFLRNKGFEPLIDDGVRGGRFDLYVSGRNINLKEDVANLLTEYMEI